MRAKLKRIFQNGLLCLISISCSLLLLELLCRFYYFGWDGFSVSKMNSFHPIGESGLIQPSLFQEIIYELKPNLDTYFKMTTFRTNSKGFRDKEYLVSKPQNTFRIAVVGDSYSMPSGVSIEDAYHTLLENRLNKESTNRSYEFINFAVGGYSVRQYIAVIKHKVLEYNPDLILIGFCATNDYAIIPEEKFHQPYKVPKTTYPFFRFYFVDGIKRTKLYEILRTIVKGPRQMERKIRPDQMEYLRKMFSEARAVSENKRLPVLVAHLEIRPTDFTVLQEIADANGFYFVDVSSYFRGTDSTHYITNKLDHHPNALANKIFAHAIYDYLKSSQLLKRKLSRIHSRFARRLGGDPVPL